MQVERPELPSLPRPKAVPTRPLVTIRPTVTFEWIVTALAGTVLLLHPEVPALGRRLLGAFGPELRSSAEYGAHVAIFLLLTLTSGRSRFAQKFPWRWVAMNLAFAMLAEAAQLFVPTRGVNVWDAACNGVGVMAGSRLAMWGPYQRRIAASSSPSPAVRGEAG